jgi:signal transduction histidine kinase
VRGNTDALADAVRNLVENALRHTPAGTTIEIDIAADPPSVRVRDAGPGIPETQHEQATHRFWRADRRRDGGGLGLAIVARIAEAHGAELRIGRAPQGGAEVSLAFPRLSAGE